MAASNVIRVSLKGILPAGEVWTVNPVWQIGGVSTFEDVTPEQCLDIATAIDAITLPAGLLALMSMETGVVGSRVEARRWDGTLEAQAEHTRTPVYGQGTTANLPFQAAIVASLRTAGVGGRARGRLYFPATGLVLTSSTLRPSSSVITSALAGVRTWLTSATTAIDGVLTNESHLSVWSRTNGSTLPVNGIRMGNVLDTQRRRRDTQVEAYQALSYPS